MSGAPDVFFGFEPYCTTSWKVEAVPVAPPDVAFTLIV
jgi:hypothetical protein